MKIETIHALNQMPEEAAIEVFKRCCGSQRWAMLMEQWRPYLSEEKLLASAERAFDQLAKDDWVDAFTAHPRIGDPESLRRKYADNGDWSAQEQQGVAGATEDVIQELAQLNAEYEARHGFIFIVCATGKSAAEMLALLKARIGNSTHQEVRNASEEQRKITRIRLEKLEP